MSAVADKSATVELDMGSDRDSREELCIKRAWCTLHRDHVGPCSEVFGMSPATNDFGPKRGKR